MADQCTPNSMLLVGLPSAANNIANMQWF